MKINFNTSTSIHNGWKYQNLGWFDDLQALFCRDYDLDPDNVTVSSFLWDPAAAHAMETWLLGLGYKVRYYEISYQVPNDGSGWPICYGLEFDDACPQFIELKLKHSL
jgi:hypothetical protein